MKTVHVYGEAGAENGSAALDYPVRHLVGVCAVQRLKPRFVYAVVVALAVFDGPL